MDDNELLDALRTGLDGADPPGPRVRAAAIQAGRWNTQAGVQAVPHEPELVAMRSSTVDAPRTFIAAGHEIEITIDHRPDLADPALVRVAITPAISEISLLEPDNEAHVLVAGSPGKWAFEVSHRLFAIAFEGPDGTLVQTPLLDTLE